MTSEENQDCVEVLLVEDDPVDVELTKETLQQAKVIVNLNVVDDGMKALEYLYRKGPYAEVTQPDVILLDLNLPKKSGREVLEQVKADKNLKHIPLVILTTSEAYEDIVRTYQLGANCYITKPVGLNEFATVVRSIGEFWFKIVKLPTRQPK